MEVGEAGEYIYTYHYKVLFLVNIMLNVHRNHKAY